MKKTKKKKKEPPSTPTRVSPQNKDKAFVVTNKTKTTTPQKLEFKRRNDPRPQVRRNRKRDEAKQDATKTKKVRT